MEANIWIYTLISVFLVSVISLIGIVTFGIKEKVFRKIVFFLVSFSAGTLFGGALFHLIPQAAEAGFTLSISVYIILGLIVFFTLEKFIHWRHCHVPTSTAHPHPLGIMNLVGDGFHNFIDGLVIGGSYLASIPLGITTTIAVLFHEVPQEIGDFGILLHAGFRKGKALLLNFISALAAVLGALVALAIGSKVAGFTEFLIPFTAGGFLYIAGSDLIPEMHKECSSARSFLQFIALFLGVFFMLALTFME